MANKKISDLPNLAAVDRATDYLEVVDSSDGISTKATPNLILGITGNPVGTSDTQVLTNKTIVAGNNTISGIANANLSTTAGDIGGVWKSYTPTPSNITVGSGTLIGRYTQIGKTVHASIYFRFAADSSVSGIFTFALPVTALSGGYYMGCVKALDAGTNYRLGIVQSETTHTSEIVHDTSGSGWSATIPFTWAINDTINISITYEAS